MEVSAAFAVSVRTMRHMMRQWLTALRACVRAALVSPKPISSVSTLGFARVRAALATLEPATKAIVTGLFAHAWARFLPTTQSRPPACQCGFQRSRLR